MAHYLIEVGYTPQAWSGQIDSQQDVVDRISPAVKAAHGTIECLYYAFGDSDLVGIIDFATSEDAAAFALTVTASGALRSYKTTPLLTVAQGVESMKRAAEVRGSYTPPLTVDLTERKASAKAR
ncbi:MAG: GYD domain-containing protein [Mycobacteriales bacterium]